MKTTKSIFARTLTTLAGLTLLANPLLADIDFHNPSYDDIRVALVAVNKHTGHTIVEGWWSFEGRKNQWAKLSRTNFAVYDYYLVLERNGRNWCPVEEGRVFYDQGPELIKLRAVEISIPMEAHEFQPGPVRRDEILSGRITEGSYEKVMAIKITETCTRAPKDITFNYHHRDLRNGGITAYIGFGDESGWFRAFTAG